MRVKIEKTIAKTSVNGIANNPSSSDPPTLHATKTECVTEATQAGIDQKLPTTPGYAESNPPSTALGSSKLKTGKVVKNTKGITIEKKAKKITPSKEYLMFLM